MKSLGRGFMKNLNTSTSYKKQKLKIIQENSNIFVNDGELLCPALRYAISA